MRVQILSNDDLLHNLWFIFVELRALEFELHKRGVKHETYSEWAEKFNALCGVKKETDALKGGITNEC